MTLSNTASLWGFLADDLLQEIFILSVTGANQYFGRLALDTRRPSFRQLPQLSISHVCSTWRQVALLTSRLWNRIYIRVINNVNILIAAEWLSRARDVAVAVRVDARSWEEEGAHHSLVIPLLSPHCVKHLDIQTAIHIPLSELPEKSVANLETLSLGYASFSVHIELNVERYPKLAHLSLAGSCRPVGPCKSLRKFDASESYLTVGQVWSFLSGCPSLEECCVSIRHDNSGRLPIATELYLPSLRILRVAFPFRFPEISFSSIIEPFTLPNLETFDINDSSIYWSTSAFSALARRSNNFPHLRTFRLGNSKIMIEAGPLLALIPSVTRISLCSSRASVAEAIFDCDTLNGLATGLLGPRLNELIVGHISNPHHFMDMVKSRMENAKNCHDGPAAFTKVHFNTRGRYANISDCLNNLRHRGIPINVIYDDN